MKHIFFSRIILIVALVLCSFSCTSDLDFEQANDLKIQPVVTTNLAYIKANESDFIGTLSYSYNANVDFFSTSFVKENLEQVELYFRLKNTINRNFTFKIEFFDVNGVHTHSDITLIIEASTNGDDMFKERPFPVNIDDLRRTSQMTFSIVMAGPPLTGTGSGRVEMSSSVTAYFDVE